MLAQQRLGVVTREHTPVPQGVYGAVHARAHACAHGMPMHTLMYVYMRFFLFFGSTGRRPRLDLKVIFGLVCSHMIYKFGAVLAKFKFGAVLAKFASLSLVP